MVAGVFVPDDHSGRYVHQVHYFVSQKFLYGFGIEIYVIDGVFGNVLPAIIYKHARIRVLALFDDPDLGFALLFYQPGHVFYIKMNLADVVSIKDPGPRSVLSAGRPRT